LTSIGSSAFDGCSSLTNVTFQSPSALTTVGARAFLAPGLSSGGSVAIDESKASLLRVLGTMMYNASVNGVVFAPYGPMDGSGNVVVSNNVTSFGASAFALCSSLTSLTLEADSALVSISDRAFYGSGLTSFAVPKSVSSIDASAFELCLSLTSLTLEADSALVSISDRLFYGSGLTSFVVPASVQSIGDSSFEGCSNLTALIVTFGSSLATVGGSAFLSSGLGSGTVTAQSSKRSLLTASTGWPSGVGVVGYGASCGEVVAGHILIPKTVSSIALGKLINMCTCPFFTLYPLPL
jgi:hypothetical protein